MSSEIEALERRERSAFSALLARIRKDPKTSALWDDWQKARRAMLNARLSAPGPDSERAVDALAAEVREYLDSIPPPKPERP